MVSLSRAWGYALLLVQVLNAAAAAIAVVALNLPEATQATVLTWNVGIAGITGAVQAFAKALPDSDKDGVPDVFEGKP